MAKPDQPDAAIGWNEESVLCHNVEPTTTEAVVAKTNAGIRRPPPRKAIAMQAIPVQRVNS